MRVIFKGTKPKYGRYLAEGTVTYTDSEQTFTETSDLIYEFAYIGEEYKQYMEIRKKLRRLVYTDRRNFKLRFLF